MLVLHSRTIAFIASFSTLIQSMIWIAGYVMYILMYSCIFKSDYFVSAGKEDDLPLTLGPYFMWYFQGSACVTSSSWINTVRGGNLRTLVSIFSIGFALNCILLIISFTLILSLFRNTKLYRRTVLYSSVVYIVSVWDAVMVGFVAADFRPLLNSKNFELSRSGNPGDLAMPYFSNVFTILILLLARFICIWLANVVLMTYLLIKNNTVKCEPQPSMTKRPTFEQDMDETPPKPKWNPPESDEKYWGERPTSNGHLSKWPVTDVYRADFNDEVSKRWKISKGLSDRASYSSLNSSNDESRSDPESKMNLSTLPKSDWALDGDRWKNVENHILESENRWKSRHQSPVAQEIENESFRSPLRSKTPSVIRNTAESFKVNNSIEASAVNTIPDTFPDTKQKSMEGFTYLGEPSTQTSDSTGIFGVKLRPVHRDSLKHERELSSSIITNNESSDAVPYAISVVIGVDTNYDDQSEDLKWPTQSSTSLSQQQSDISFSSPPDAPPLKNLDMKQSGSPEQMSLEEAIKTRRPLKPLNRPGIDTSC